MASASQPGGLVSFEQARSMVEQHTAHAATPGSETTDLLSSVGRILAEPVLADRDFPAFHRATRDGYALRAAEVTRVPAKLNIIGEIKAGDSPSRIVIEAGQAAAIMTGAPIPPGADAVVMIEYTSQSENSVEIQRAVGPGENFVPRGAEARAGQVLIARGTRLDA